MLAVISGLGSIHLWAQTNASALISQLIEVSGKVEVSLGANGAWRSARPNELLHAGDHIRTGPDSRAALRLSSQSVIRIDQSTVVDITSPTRPMARSRFRLRWGALFFLNREKPADIEFETPLATGAIRGTEFFLAAAQAGGDTTLALFDGAVELRTVAEAISLAGGQQAVVQPGRPAVISAVVPARNLIQWTLYYPGVLNASELAFADSERGLLANSVEAYQAGDLLGALAALPEETPTTSDSVRVFRAALKLAVGRVDETERLLAQLPGDAPLPRALREVIAAVRLSDWPEPPAQPTSTMTSSEWLAHSYYLQSRSRLAEALMAARRSIELAPGFGFGWARVAELEFSFEHRKAAREALRNARRLSPRNAEALALEGFIALDERDARAALTWFGRALALDAALGQAWLGRGLAHEQLRAHEEGIHDLQAAAAFEPQRSLFRSYLGKAFSQAQQDGVADKDFRLAKAFDPGDPTPWLYSALHHQQVNRVNESVRELEHSIALNDNRSVFRSRLVLDRDRAIASADLAAIYEEAGFSEAGRLEASRAVGEDYANFSGHLFLARSLQAREDPNQYDLRLETPRQSELLLANLLAPAGGANLSQLLSQQDHLQYFEPRPFGASSLTEYGSRGDWDQSASLFGTVDGLSYAFDSQYLSHQGQRPNNDLEQTRFILSAKEQVTPADSVYAQVGLLEANSGDVASRYDPATANPGLRAKERQEPTFYGGYHHEWGPGSHTLILVAHLRDHLSLTDPEANALFLQQSGGTTIRAQPQFGYHLDFASQFELTSVELQQIWENEHHRLIAGARYQRGSVETDSTLRPPLPPLSFQDSIAPDLERINGYAYYQIRPVTAVRVTAGLSYDHLQFPYKADLPPLDSREQERSRLSPQAALDLESWSGGHWRAAYSRSLGGLYFDNSVRLEPSQLAGFTTAYRSLIPESVAGLVPGTEFETWGIGFDQVFPTGTYFGVEGDLLRSNGERGVGALTNSLPVPLPDSPTTTRQTLDFRERSLSLYANQLVGGNWSFGAGYRLSEAKLTGRFPELPAAAPGVALLEQDERAVLGHLQLSAIFNHPAGFFAQWHTDFFHQNNFGYTAQRDDTSFWQHNLFVGYRFPHRRAEVRLGVLNLTDRDYRLNPLNLQNELPRGRTFVASLKLNF